MRPSPQSGLSGACCLWPSLAEPHIGPTRSPPAPHNASEVAGLVRYGTAPGQLDQAAASGTDVVYSYCYRAVAGGMTYHSPILHHVLLTGLQPGQRYWYRVGGRLTNGSAAPESQQWSFRLPAGPPAELRIAVLGDPGKLVVAPSVKHLAVPQRRGIVGTHLGASPCSPAAAALNSLQLVVRACLPSMHGCCYSNDKQARHTTHPRHCSTWPIQSPMWCSSLATCPVSGTALCCATPAAQLSTDAPQLWHWEAPQPGALRLSPWHANSTCSGARAVHASTHQPEQQSAGVPCSADADLYFSNQTDGNWSHPAVPASQQLRWDAWARLTEPLLATVPAVFVPGNQGACLL